MINSANSGQQQAWTPEMIFRYFNAMEPPPFAHVERLTKDINAALAAAYTEAFIDVRSELESRIEALTQQLAAERSKVLQLESFGEQLADCQEKYNFKANLTQEIVELNKQLAAEREHRNLVDKVLDNRCLQLRKMEDQLAAECQRREQAERMRRETQVQFNKMEATALSAQAAIDAALKAPWTDVGQILAPIDLSALHERDAEVTEKAKKDYAPIAYRMGYECAAKEAAKVREPLVDLLREAHGRLGDTAFPSLSKRIADALAEVKEQ